MTMNDIFFTSDTHFNHTHIIEFSNRPFKNIEHMERILINNWNSVVSPDDTVFHLGDVGFYNKNAKQIKLLRKKLNGNIIFIKGNHDHNAISIINDMTIERYGKVWHLVHNPADALGEYNIVGHVHNAWKIINIRDENGVIGVAVNVGVDVWNFTPVKFSTINKLVERFKNGNDE